MKKKSKKSKLKQWFQSLIIIPKYEKQLKDQTTEIQTLEMEKSFLQSQVYKYKNKVIKLKRKEAEKNDKN